MHVSILSDCVYSCRGYFMWDKTYTKLFCPNVCKDDHDPISEDRCCSCNSRPGWACDTNTSSGTLDVEYIGRNGQAVVIDRNHKLFDIYVIEHTGSYLSNIPENVCDFSRLVEINFASNHISYIGNISCLTMIDTLNLARNEIQTILNNTFASLTTLRILDLSQNMINVIEVGTLSNTGVGMTYMLFNNNTLEDVDITNIALDTSFCKKDYSGNQIKEVTNGGGWSVNINTTYGSGGLVDLSDNLFKEFFDFVKLGFQDIKLLGKFLGFAFDIRNAKWNCDCRMQPFLELSEDVIKKIYREIFDVRCFSPDNMKGHLIIDYVRNSSYDSFICDINKFCPYPCYCFVQPGRNRTVVNCSNSGLVKMPNNLPNNPNIFFDISFNNVIDIGELEYLSNISLLDISGNNLDRISESSLNKLHRASSIDLRGNYDIKTLPRQIQNFNPCVFHFGDLTIDCSCEDIWIKEWILTSKGSSQCNHTRLLQCNTETGIVLAIDLPECITNNDGMKTLAILLMSATLVVTLSTIFCHYFRFEIYLFWRRLQQATHIHDMENSCKFDAYLSLNDTANRLIRYVSRYFVPYLEYRGYRLLFPSRDSLPGVSREEEILANMTKCRNFIVFASADYFDPEQLWCNMEWRHAWNFYTQSLHSRLILVNYDQLRSCDVPHSSARAFVRLRIYEDFANRRHDFLPNVVRKLGPVVRRYRFLRNAKPKFNLEPF